MDRSYVHLLVRMSLGLVLGIVVWTTLRGPAGNGADAGAESAAAASPSEPSPPADEKVTTGATGNQKPQTSDKAPPADKKDQKMELATFGGGCFWCVEAVLQRIEGVEKVVSGYAGGETISPTYEEVCTGLTGHAEVVQVTFDPSRVSFVKLLEIFMKTHDPTTLNQQGHDVGTQYRSIILTHNDAQAQQAKEVIAKLDAAGIFSDPIVTQVEPLTVFYAGEQDHQNYFNRNPNSRYCQVVVRSKVEKLEKFFGDMLKSDGKTKR